MGAAAEHYQARMGISREDQDAYAAESHARAAVALKAGRLAEVIAPVTLERRANEVMEHDEGIRPGTTVEVLDRVRPQVARHGPGFAI